MNTSKIEQVKKLIEKAKKFQDFELLEMANTLLDEAMAGTGPVIDTSDVEWEPGVIGGDGPLPDHLIDHDWEPPASELPPPRKRGRPKKNPAPAEPAPAKNSRKNFVDQFTIKRAESKMATEPINLGPRANSFSDDGTEFRGPKDQTPDFVPAKRDRPPAQKTLRVCGQAKDGSVWNENACGADCYVSDLAAEKDLFLCEDCLLKRKKGRK